MYANTILSNLRKLPNSITPDLMWRTFQTISNWLPTSRPFQEQVGSCLLCHREAGDALEHYSRCTHVHASARSVLPFLRSTAITPYVFFLADDLRPPVAASIVLLHDLLMWTLRAKRNGSTATHTELFGARAYQHVRRHPTLTPLLRPG